MFPDNLPIIFKFKCGNNYHFIKQGYKIIKFLNNNKRVLFFFFDFDFGLIFSVFGIGLIFFVFGLGLIFFVFFCFGLFFLVFGFGLLLSFFLMLLFSQCFVLQRCFSWPKAQASSYFNSHSRL